MQYPFYKKNSLIKMFGVKIMALNIVYFKQLHQAIWDLELISVFFKEGKLVEEGRRRWKKN